MQKIKVQLTEIQKARDDLEELHGQMTKLQSDLEQELASLDGMWAGEAKTAYEQETHARLQAFSEALAGIQNLIHLERDAVVEYGMCEALVAEKIAALRI